MARKKKRTRMEVPVRVADSMVNESMGVCIVFTNAHKHKTGELVEFNVINDPDHALTEQVYKVTGVYDGKGVEPGYAVLIVKYWGSKDDE